MLSTQQLTVDIGGKRVCSALELALQPGQRWGLLGINGVGKTTLLHTLAGLRPATSGEILWDGAPITSLPPRRRAQALGVLFQAEDDAFPGTVLETVLMGRHPWLGRWQWEGEDDRTRAHTALDQVGLSGFEGRPLDTLSGGERRRVELATLLTQAPQLYLLDEPSNHLDPHHQMALLGLLARRVTEHGKALLMTLHDINLATRFCDHLLLLFGDGEWRGGPVAEVLDSATLSRLYGHPMLAVDGPRGPVYLPAYSEA